MKVGDEVTLENGILVVEGKVIAVGVKAKITYGKKIETKKPKVWSVS